VRHPLTPLVAASLLAMALMSNPVMAASCKGMSKSACSSSNSCSWVKAYKTKKGNTVDAHCRAKPGKSSKKKSSSDKKSSSKTSSKSSSSSSDSKRASKSTSQ